MGHADYFKPGDWNARCSMCGKKFKASELVKNWQGQWRCKTCNEPRHPQDFVRATKDTQTVDFVQDPPDIHIQVCTFNGLSAFPDYAQPDCSIPDNTLIDPTMSI